jgi:hypothetical protein
MLLPIAGFIVSIGVGLMLGKIIQVCEEKECSKNADALALSKTKTPHTAPGADWGTWSSTTPHQTWLDVGHDPDGEQW